MALAKPILTMHQKADHYGQVVPMEGVEKGFELVEGAVRLPCVCRRVTTGNMNARYCYGLTMDRQLMDALDDSFSLELLTREEALDSIRKLDKEGLVHSVWTFKTPFIGGLCNCDQDCMAYRITHARGDYPVMFRAEWVAEVIPDNCNGCRQCMRRCQYGAIRYSSNNKKVIIDPTACYGCGVCRPICQLKAFKLLPRAEVKEAAGDDERAYWNAAQLRVPRIEADQHGGVPRFPRGPCELFGEGEVPEIKVTLQAHYEMAALGKASTRLKFNVNWMGSQLPAENKRGMMGAGDEFRAPQARV